MDDLTEPTRCASCETPLEPLFPETATSYQFENALWVGLFGGYGMFVDEIDGGDDRLPGSPYIAAALCHDCAHEACDALPWLAKLIKPATSHSHSYSHDWTGHSGWDLPHNTEQ